MWSGSDWIYRAVLRATRGSDQQVNTLHYMRHLGLLGDLVSPQALADALADDVLPAFKALYHSDWTIQPIEVYEEQDPLDPTAPRHGWTSGTAAAGTKADPGDLLPTPCCCVVRLTTDRIGRRARGRLFLGGTNGESDQSNGNWGNTQHALFQALADAIPHEPDVTVGGADGDMKWVVYSRTARAQSQPLYGFAVQNAVAQAPVHWLRSRQ